MNHFLLIEERPDSDSIEIAAAGSIKEAAEWCLAEDYDPTRIVEVNLLTDAVECAGDAMKRVIEVAFAIWRDSGSMFGKDDADFAPAFLQKHCMDLVEGEVELCLLAAEEDAEHIRQEDSNMRVL